MHRIGVNIERLTSCWNKQLSSNNKISSFINILSSNNKPKQQITLNSKQQGMTSCHCEHNALYNLYLFLSCFLLMLLPERFCIYFCYLHLSSCKLLVESALTYLFFTLNSFLVYFYASSPHCIYLFMFNSDILSFGM